LFFLVFLAVAGGTTLSIYLFIVTVDPFDTLPLSPPFPRWQVDGNARYAFPSLARSTRFDSANFGTSTSRLLQPAVLDGAFHAHFANLAMNSGSAYEQSRLMEVFTRAHPNARVVTVGLDVVWCVTEGGLRRFSNWRFPEWLYADRPWSYYRHMLDLYTLEKAVQAFAEFTGLKPRNYGSDGYTSFVPPDNTYDAARAARHLAGSGPEWPLGDHAGNPETWRYVALDLLRQRLAAMAPTTRKVLYFVPYNRAKLPARIDQAEMMWNECKRRVLNLAGDIPNTAVVDFMFDSPITDRDTNYWDPFHYRQPVADRLAADLAQAAERRPSAAGDYRLLFP